MRHSSDYEDSSNTARTSNHFIRTLPLKLHRDYSLQRPAIPSFVAVHQNPPTVQYVPYQPQLSQTVSRYVQSHASHLPSQNRIIGAEYSRKGSLRSYGGEGLQTMQSASDEPLIRYFLSAVLSETLLLQNSHQKERDEENDFQLGLLQETNKQLASRVEQQFESKFDKNKVVESIRYFESALTHFKRENKKLAEEVGLLRAKLAKAEGKGIAKQTFSQKSRKASKDSLGPTIPKEVFQGGLEPRKPANLEYDLRYLKEKQIPVMEEQKEGSVSQNLLKENGELRRRVEVYERQVGDMNMRLDKVIMIEANIMELVQENARLEGIIQQLHNI